MKLSYRKEKIKFRFVDFPEKLIPALKGILSRTNWQSRRFRRTGGLVVVIELDKAFDTKKLCSFIRDNKIPMNKYGLWISLVTERDTDGVHVPDFAVKLLRQLGGRLDFSFTSV